MVVNVYDSRNIFSFCYNLNQSKDRLNIALFDNLCVCVCVIESKRTQSCFVCINISIDRIICPIHSSVATLSLLSF